MLPLPAVCIVRRRSSRAARTDSKLHKAATAVNYFWGRSGRAPGRMRAGSAGPLRTRPQGVGSPRPPRRMPAKPVKPAPVRFGKKWNSQPFTSKSRHNTDAVAYDLRNCTRCPAGYARNFTLSGHDKHMHAVNQSPGGQAAAGSMAAGKTCRGLASSSTSMLSSSRGACAWGRVGGFTP